MVGVAGVYDHQHAVQSALDVGPVTDLDQKGAGFPSSILIMGLYTPTLYFHGPILSPVSTFPETNGLSIPSGCSEIQLRVILLSCLIASSVYSTE